MRIFKITLTLATILATTPAIAQTLSADIEEAATRFLAKFAQAQEANGYSVSFETNSVDHRIALAECNTALQTEFTGDPWKTQHPSIQVACAGERPWRMFVTSTVSINGPALVAARPLARGERLTANMVTTQNLTVNASRRGVLRSVDTIEGMEVRRPVNANTIITPDMLSAPDAIQRGDHVVIVAKSGNFSVRSRGKALSSGAVGEQVMVENLNSSRTIRANVVAPGRVEVPM